MSFKNLTEIEKVVSIAPAIKMLTKKVVTFVACENVKVNENAVLLKNNDVEGIYAELENADKNKNIFVLEGVGIFAAGNSKVNADKAAKMFLENGTVPEESEKENLRASGKTVIVTGSAQGFGQGIAEELLAEGANVIIADLNAELAQKNAEEMCKKYGEGKAMAVMVNVSDKDSVKEMVEKTVLAYGGIDTLVSNAGIVRAGSLEEMTLENFELVTKVNYNAYFLCAKFVSNIMKIQNKFDSEYFMDIIQINSKSGLTGSNKNFAYAGSKFGGIGLTQSFALELVPFNIKVNSICPGNFLDGPLWCDPERGLFKQYLDAGKVPGAKTVADVKKFYEAKVPMNRGCRTEDVMKAIFYCMEQQYETGQAIPVTGGQNMLK